MTMIKTLLKTMMGDPDPVHRRYALFRMQHPKLHAALRPISRAYYARIAAAYALRRRVPYLPYPEAEVLPQHSIEDYLAKIGEADILSWDVFDTLILRRLSEPRDVFDLVARQSDMPDFATRRRTAQRLATQESPTGQPSVVEIYRRMGGLTDDERSELMALEFDAELAVCRANPYLYRLYQEVEKQQKPMIAVSDMYWDKEHLLTLLHACGYTAITEVYASCDLGCAKVDGKLQQAVAQRYPNRRILHIGDDPNADTRRVAAPTWRSMPYRNVSSIGNLYRPHPVTLTGKLYNGLINAYQHAGESHLDEYYDFGYTYGGLLTLGYCRYIDRTCGEDPEAVLLFTARDSELFWQEYKTRYNRCDSQYVYVSREAVYKAALPHSFEHFYNSLFRAKAADSEIDISTALEQADLSFLSAALPLSLPPDGILNDRTLPTMREFLLQNLASVTAHFEPLRTSCLAYLTRCLEDHRHVYIVDLGWRGSVFVWLRHLLRSVRDLTVKGFVLGSTDGDLPRALVENGDLLPYAFSHRHGRDVRLEMRHIMLAEALFSSAEPTTVGYTTAPDGTPLPVPSERRDKAHEGVYRSLREGMRAFCQDWAALETKWPLPLDVDGHDALAPLRLVCDAYPYMLRLFGDLPITDIAGKPPTRLADALRRLGYRR